MKKVFCFWNNFNGICIIFLIVFRMLLDEVVLLMDECVKRVWIFKYIS